MVRITDADLHPHLRGRMDQRGVTRNEIERTLTEGRDAADAKPGILGKVMVFPYEGEWLGQHYQEKEVTVYYRKLGEDMVLLIVKARYGKDFQRGASG